MTSGLEIRAQIDSENVRGLLLLNGGGAVALLAFLPTILGEPNFATLARAILWALLLFQVGLLVAVVHNRLRRICSLKYESHGYRPPIRKLLGITFRKPIVCHLSQTFMWISAIAFLLAGLTVFTAGLRVVGSTSEQHIEGAAPNKMLQPTAKPPRAFASAELARYIRG